MGKKSARSVMYSVSKGALALSVLTLFSSFILTGVTVGHRREFWNEIEDLSKKSPYFEEYVKENIKEIENLYESGQITQQTYIDEISQMKTSDYKRKVVFELPDIQDSVKKELKERGEKLEHLDNIEMISCVAGLGGAALSGINVIALNKINKKEDEKEF